MPLSPHQSSSIQTTSISQYHLLNKKILSLQSERKGDFTKLRITFSKFSLNMSKKPKHTSERVPDYKRALR